MANLQKELSDCLSEIFSAWQRITCNNPQLLDLRTLEILQGRHPVLSLADRQHIREAFQQGEVFRHVDDSQLRAQMLDASLNYPMMIPSLKTFLENTKYLKAMTDVVKKILPSNSKGTIRETMLRYYMMSESRSFSIQCSENSYIEKEAPSRYGFWSAYRQVYLFAMRNFCGLTDCHPLGFTRASRARCPDSFEVWERFRSLISRVGFAFPGSKKVRQDRADLVAIRAFVSRLRPPELFTYNESQVSELTAHVISILSSMDPRPLPGLDSIQACDRSETWCLENRCGMTDTESFFYDQKYLFLDNVYSPNQLARESVTTFAVKRNIFKSFFLDFEIDENPNMNRQQVQDCQNIVSQGIPVATVENGTNMELCSAEDRTVEDHTATDNGMAMELFSAEDHTATEDNGDIIWQSPEACRWTFRITPDDFYMACKPLLRKLTGVIFCDIIKKEALSLCSASVATQFPDFVDLQSSWLAKVEEDSVTLQILTPKQVSDKCREGRCIIFHGRKGSFKPKLSPSAITPRIFLPRCDQGRWRLEGF